MLGACVGFELPANSEGRASGFFVSLVRCRVEGGDGREWCSKADSSQSSKTESDSITVGSQGVTVRTGLKLVATVYCCERIHPLNKQTLSCLVHRDGRNRAMGCTAEVWQPLTSDIQALGLHGFLRSVIETGAKAPQR